jgi:hypothetical protein
MSLDDLSRAVSDAMRQRMQQSGSQQATKRGMITGSAINIEGRSYPYSVAVDMAVSPGDWVWVVLYNNIRAVVVGR